MNTAKERPILFSAPMVQAILAGRKTQTRRIVKPQPASHLLEGEWIPSKCRYGQEGDRLWVRETWAPIRFDDTKLIPNYVYAADGAKPSCLAKWRPSIHMPRCASRITLEITDVRVERLQEISEEDAEAEGFVAGDRESETDAFHNLWLKINGRDSWDANPWVWVVEFRRLTNV